MPFACSSRTEPQLFFARTDTQFFIYSIFNLLLSTATAFGVKDYPGQLVNLLGRERARWRRNLRLQSEHDERLRSPSPGPLSDWGWGAPGAEARGNGDTSSPIWRCDPSLHLGAGREMREEKERKSRGSTEGHAIVMPTWYLTE